MIAIPNGSRINYKYLRTNKRYLNYRLFINAIYPISVLAALLITLKVKHVAMPRYLIFLIVMGFMLWLAYIIKSSIVSLVFGSKGYGRLDQ
jgi:hypothetical protein